MKVRTIAVAAAFGVSALAVSGCVESSGYIEPAGHYGGYHRSTTVVVERDRDNRRHDRDHRWDRRHDNDHSWRDRNDRDDHDRDRHDNDRHADSRHSSSRYDRDRHCRDPRSRECRDYDRHH